MAFTSFFFTSLETLTLKSIFTFFLLVENCRSEKWRYSQRSSHWRNRYLFQRIQFKFRIFNWLSRGQDTHWLIKKTKRYRWLTKPRCVLSSPQILPSGKLSSISGRWFFTFVYVQIGCLTSEIILVLYVSVRVCVCVYIYIYGYRERNIVHICVHT